MIPEFEEGLFRVLLPRITSPAPRLYIADWPCGIATATRFCNILQERHAEWHPVTSCQNEMDVVVFPCPLLHSPDTVAHLTAMRAMLEPGGMVIAPFRNGQTRAAEAVLQSGTWLPPLGGEKAPVSFGEYSLTGVELVLSRAEYDMAHMEMVFDSGAEPELLGWIVAGHPRVAGISPFGQKRRDRRARAILLNRKGEKQYAAGDYVAAAALFGQAIDLWNEEAVFFNNFASSLFALGQYDESVCRVRDALHLDPSLRAARENYRAIMNALGRREEAESLLAFFGHDT